MIIFLIQSPPTIVTRIAGIQPHSPMTQKPNASATEPNAIPSNFMKNLLFRHLNQVILISFYIHEFICPPLSVETIVRVILARTENCVYKARNAHYKKVQPPEAHTLLAVPVLVCEGRFVCPLIQDDILAERDATFHRGRSSHKNSVICTIFSFVDSTKQKPQDTLGQLPYVQ